MYNSSAQIVAVVGVGWFDLHFGKAEPSAEMLMGWKFKETSGLKFQKLSGMSEF